MQGMIWEHFGGEFKGILRFLPAAKKTTQLKVNFLSNEVQKKVKTVQRAKNFKSKVRSDIRG